MWDLSKDASIYLVLYMQDREKSKSKSKDTLF